MLKPQNLKLKKTFLGGGARESKSLLEPEGFWGHVAAYVFLLLVYLAESVRKVCELTARASKRRDFA